MSVIVKAWVIVAVSLILLGAVLFTAVMITLGWDFGALSTTRYETNEHVPSESFSDISIQTDTADIILLPAEDEGCKIIAHEQENVKHTVKVKDGVLVIETEDTRKWYEYIGISWGSPSLTVYLPKSEYGALSVKSSTGMVRLPAEFSFASIDVETDTGIVQSYASAMGAIKIETNTGAIGVEGVSAASLSLSVTTGKVTVTDAYVAGDASVAVSTGKAALTDVTCKNLFSSGSTGDILLKNVIAAEKLSVERDTGDVTLDGADAAEIFIETDTGDVKGTLLSDKIFFAETDTGRREIPKTVTGGRCEIKTDTGDIVLEIKK